MENTPLKAAVTPEMLEQGKQLANIMMPRFMKQTRELFQREPGQTHGRLVHYTTAETALKIIRTKRFWMRNTNCMSDFSEVQHGFEILNSFFSNEAKKESFTEAIDDCIPGVASEAIAAFSNSWSDIRLNSYIACLSEHQDSEDLNGRLSMWRAFGGSCDSGRDRAQRPIRFSFNSPAEPHVQLRCILIGICGARGSWKKSLETFALIATIFG